MTIASLDRRLRKAERREGLYGDLGQMTDAQLWRIVRSGYRHLNHAHRSLTQWLPTPATPLPWRTGRPHRAFPATTAKP